MVISADVVLVWDLTTRTKGGQKVCWLCIIPQSALLPIVESGAYFWHVTNAEQADLPWQDTSRQGKSQRESLVQKSSDRCCKASWTGDMLQYALQE